MRAPRFIHQHKFDLAADALLLASGLFALVASIGITLLWVTGDIPDDVSESASVLSQLLSLLMLVIGAFVGPALAWRLHGRRLRARLLFAPFLSILAVSGLMILLSFVASLVHWLLSPLTAWEFTGAIVILVVTSTLFIGILWHAMRDAMAPAGDPPQLELLRLLSLLGLVVLAFVVAGAAALGYGGGIAEALIFAMLMGFAGSMTTVFGNRLDDAGALHESHLRG